MPVMTVITMNGVTAMIEWHGKTRFRNGIYQLKRGRVTFTWSLDRRGTLMRAIKRFFGTHEAWAMLIHPEWFENEEGDVDD